MLFCIKIKNANLIMLSKKNKNKIGNTSVGIDLASLEAALLKGGFVPCDGKRKILFIVGINHDSKNHKNNFEFGSSRFVLKKHATSAPLTSFDVFDESFKEETAIKTTITKVIIPDTKRFTKKQKGIVAFGEGTLIWNKGVVEFTSISLTRSRSIEEGSLHKLKWYDGLNEVATRRTSYASFYDFLYDVK